MAYYNYKELRDSLPPEMVEEWEREDGSADYDSTLWIHGARYIRQLEKELEEAEKILARIYDAAGKRMTAEEPTADERLEFLNAWKAAGECLASLNRLPTQPPTGS